MITSIANIIKNSNMSIENTVYREDSHEVIHYPLILDEFLEWAGKDKAEDTFHPMERYLDCISGKKEDKTYVCFIKSLGIFQEILLFVEKMNKETREYSCMEIIGFLRKKKKEIEVIHRELEELYEMESAKECFRLDKPLSEGVIWYKDVFYCSSLYHMSHLIDELKQIKHRELINMPLFITSTFHLKEAIAENRPIGVIGGPCLFGNNEVIMKIIHRSGEVYYYDFSEPKNERQDELEEEDVLGDHVCKYQGEIAKITFINKKRGITADEYRNILYTLEFANAVKGKLLIPIPDMSYRKYLKAVCDGVEESVALQAIQEFQTIVYQITDMYLAWIDRIKQKYPSVTVEVLHERREDLCSLFYETREPYYSNYHHRGHITSNPWKRESIIDYIMMVAMPFYLWGTKEIIQVDCVYEMDSHRKCKKIHGKTFNLHGVFYPEHLSKDGSHTIFTAENQWKEYMYL